MRKLILLLAMLAMVVVVTSVAAPAMAQDPKAEKQAAKAEKQAAKAEKQAAKAEKQAGAKDQMKEMPKTGGVPVNAALLGLGACAMLVGGGLLVRRVTR
jgi:LPXTG-motif cell wall-anchored protein